MTRPTLLERVLAEARASTYLKRLGVSVEEIRDEEARARLRPTEATANRAGMLHGGSIATLLLAAGEAAAASAPRSAAASSVHPAMLSVSFIDAVAAGTGLEAVARVLRRGRDVVHVIAHARTTDARTAAQALLVYGHTDAPTSRENAARSRVAQDDQIPRERPSASPYMHAAGAMLLEGPAEWACMMLPCEPNEGAVGRIHDGALVGLVDTCAAMAAFRSCRERQGGPSATVSLSLSWSEVTLGTVRAGARVLGRRGAVFTTEAEVWGSDGIVTASGQVCYRIAGAGAWSGA